MGVGEMCLECGRRHGHGLVLANTCQELVHGGIQDPAHDAPRPHSPIGHAKDACARSACAACSRPWGHGPLPHIVPIDRAALTCEASGTAFSATAMSGLSESAAFWGSSAFALSPGLSCSNVSLMSVSFDPSCSNLKTWMRLPVLPASNTMAYFSTLACCSCWIVFDFSCTSGDVRGTSMMTARISTICGASSSRMAEGARPVGVGQGRTHTHTEAVGKRAAAAAHAHTHTHMAAFNRGLQTGR